MEPSDPELLPVGPLRGTELADAEALVREAGWNQTAGDWQIFIELGTVQAIRTQAGRVIATAATLAYGGRFAWISMVLVTAEYRRRGLATQLLYQCIDDLTAQYLVPVLDATPAGREVYRKLGFRDAWAFQRFARGTPGPPANTPPPPRLLRVPSLLPIGNAHWPALCAYDAGVFGADRTDLLTHLRGRVPNIDRIAVRDGRIVGALLGRDGRVATQIGPLVADDDVTARTLLAHALDMIQGPVFIDVPNAKVDMIDYLAAHGFTPQRPLSRMLLKRYVAFDDGQRTYAVVGPEFG